MPVRFVIIGGGPAGNTAATVAASLGAEVTMIENQIIGGAAHLKDCIPSKAMIATGNELTELQRARTMGLEASGGLDVGAPRERIGGMENPLRGGAHHLAGAQRGALLPRRGARPSRLESQGVLFLRGTGRRTGAYTVPADTDDATEEIEADAILLA